MLPQSVMGCALWLVCFLASHRAAEAQASQVGQALRGSYTPEAGLAPPPSDAANATDNASDAELPLDAPEGPQNGLRLPLDAPVWLQNGLSNDVALGALRNFSLEHIVSANKSLSLGNAGPGYCVSGWCSRYHGHDYDVGSVRGVDLNGCLTQCWHTEGCWCTTFEREKTVLDRHSMGDQWMQRGTCWMHHKCDQGAIDKGVAHFETCFVNEYVP
jgi:hypothetical protein